MQSDAGSVRPLTSSDPLAPSRRMRRKFCAEVAALRLPRGPESPALVTEADVHDLPGVVRRYLDFMRVVGKPWVWSFRAHATGRFRMGPEKPWLECEAWQYDTCFGGIARIFHMRLRFGGIVPVYVRDTYAGRHGRMLGRAFDAIPVVDVADAKIDTGELVTYLNDAILFAPAMLLGPSTRWQAVSDHAFDVALTDGDRTVRARVFLDDRGAPIDFETTDRFGTDPADPKGMVRARWTTPIRGWHLDADRPVQTGGQAIWHFVSGVFAYADFELQPEDVELNVQPR